VSVSPRHFGLSRIPTLAPQLSKFIGFQLGPLQCGWLFKVVNGEVTGVTLFFSYPSEFTVLCWLISLFEIHCFIYFVPFFGCFRPECKSKPCYSIFTGSRIVMKLYFNQPPTESIQMQTCLGMVIPPYKKYF